MTTAVGRLFARKHGRRSRKVPFHSFDSGFQCRPLSGLWHRPYGWLVDKFPSAHDTRCLQASFRLVLQILCGSAEKHFPSDLRPFKMLADSRSQIDIEACAHRTSCFPNTKFCVAR